MTGLGVAEGEKPEGHPKERKGEAKREKKSVCGRMKDERKEGTKAT